MTSLTPLIAQGSGGSGNVTFLVSLVLLVGIFYFLLIRPQQRRVRAQRELIQSIAVGDEVITIGGAFGTVVEMDEESVTLMVQPDGTRIRFVKSAIARKFVEEPEEPDLGEPGEGAGEGS